MPITRRTLLGMISSSTFILTAATNPVAALGVAEHLSAASFPQGVASGDPQPGSVMLWTRAVPAGEANTKVHLLVEVSTDEAFSQLVLSNPVTCSSDSDFTLRAYVNGLKADTQYFYRFRGAQSLSRIGRTRTAPAPGTTAPTNIAFASCQCYEQGHYGSWARMIAEDRAAPDDQQIAFVLHLGDFIYERSWHKHMDGAEQQRKIAPFPDGVEAEHYNYAQTLADYRHLYKVYLSDPHLQEARARWPFVCTWDDHEYANDNFQSYTTYQSEALLNPPRKLSSNQAWFEFIPAVLDELVDQQARDFQAPVLGKGDEADNHAAVESMCIYRKLSWGNTLDLVLTDSRSYRSGACVDEDLYKSLDLPLNPAKLIEIADAGRDYSNGTPPDKLPYGDGTTPNPAKDRAPGTMLGAQQKQWFLDTMEHSKAAWKVWGNAIPLVPMRLDISTIPFNDYEDSVVNVDGWGGFPVEVRALMDGLAARKVSGVVSLSGDHHLHAAGAINRSPAEHEAPPVVVDFAVAGISSSPVIEDMRKVAAADHSSFSALIRVEEDGEETPMWNMSMLDGVLASLFYANTALKAAARWLGPNEANHGLNFMDVTANGYGLARFDTSQLTVRLVSLEDCRGNFTVPPAIKYVATFDLPNWEDGDSPKLQEPKFEGIAPFPFDRDTV